MGQYCRVDIGHFMSIRTVSALIFILILQYKIHKTLKPAFMPIC